MGSFLTIVMFGAIAVFVFLRLLSVLGRREGHEQDPIAHRRLPSDAADDSYETDNVVTLPGASAPSGPSPAEQIDRMAPQGSALHAGLTQIQLADRDFEPASFVSGAKAAYEMIVTAFAAGDKQKLEPLLGPEIYESFADAIDARIAANYTAETNVIGIREAVIEDAEVDGSVASVRMKFVTEMITVTRNEDGAVMDGHPNTVAQITDHWTFERDVTSGDPNWLLVSTTLD